ncbi:MAG: glycoside hydrolase family 3 protein [Armatimonadetes bacterium]|nr:glycoside hydrolase family 3 protein [Armatimonadota bacterium]
MSSWAEQVLDELSPQELVGQLVLSGVGERREEILKLAEEGKIGALIFYGKDMPDPQSTAQLANEFQRRSKVPVLISADFEAGTGFIMKGGTKLPSNMAIGATGSVELAKRCGEVTAKEARAVGVHWIFAPVVDVNINPENPIINIRSFGSDPDDVARLAVAWISGCQSNGCLATAKHFPGHGDTSEDSHRVMPVVPHDIERMWQVELKPFQAAINAGVASIMTAHIHFPAIDPTPGLPATLSRKTLTELLRQKMGFRGLVVTDAMSMHAIKLNFNMDEAVVMAVNAGADVIIADDAPSTYEALWKAVQEGKLSMERVREAAKRILEAKEWCGLDRRKFVNEEEVSGIVGCAEHQEVARLVAESSVTLLKNEGVLPLPPQTRLFAVVAETQRWTGEKPSTELAQLLGETFPNSTIHFVSRNPTLEEVDVLARRLTESPYDAVLLCIFPRAEAYQPESALAGGGMLALAGKLSSKLPLVVASFGSPYPLAKFATSKALLCAYSDCPASLQCGVKVLTGKLEARGKLPVNLQ